MPQSLLKEWLELEVHLQFQRLFQVQYVHTTNREERSDRDQQSVGALVRPTPVEISCSGAKASSLAARPVAGLFLQKSTNYKTLLWKVTYKNKATCGSWPPRSFIYAVSFT